MMAMSNQELIKNSRSLTVVSYHMHGFNQGCCAIEDLITDRKPDIFMLQEHWLTPSNLCTFERYFKDYFAFGSSAMSGCLESGLLRGRPFGGVMMLVSKDLRRFTTAVHCDERFNIVKVFNRLFVNVYFPCSGTANRLTLYTDLLADIWAWREHFSDCECIIAGDFNTVLDSKDAVAECVTSFINNCSLVRCDDLFFDQKVDTYVNLSLRQNSQIDYVLVSKASDVANFFVLDPDVNYSDHLPLIANLSFTEILPYSAPPNKPHKFCLHQLRWDKADRGSYYSYTGNHLQPLVSVVDKLKCDYEAGDVSVNDVCICIETTYRTIVSVLRSAAELFVPKCRKGFFKFWWTEELSLLKEASVESNRVWKAAGKPRHGPIFLRRQSCRLQYRKQLNENRKMEAEHYSNDLHEALAQKNNTAFWNCWRSKFEATAKCSQVDGCADPDIIADKFACHFKKAFSCNDPRKADILREEFLLSRPNYNGVPLTEVYSIDTELVSKVVSDLKCGKAADIDSLSVEHLRFSHPCLPVVLAKLFQLMVFCSFVPEGFRYNYIVPLPKPKECYSKTLTCDDFRGIAISPVLSKVFEHCMLDRFGSFLNTSDNQFGFKKGLGCSFAIRIVRNVVDGLTKGGSTVNLCALDLSKAFDKVNHHALYLKLMKILIPNELLDFLVFWLSRCCSCVKWIDACPSSSTLILELGRALSYLLFFLHYT